MTANVALCLTESLLEEQCRQRREQRLLGPNGIPRSAGLRLFSTTPFATANS
jgi:hypothetical protein